MQRCQRLQAVNGFIDRALRHQGDDLDGATKADGNDYQHNHQTDISLDKVIHAVATPAADATAASSLCSVCMASSRVFHRLYAITSMPLKKMAPPMKRTT